VRRAGGGRKPLTEVDPDLVDNLKRLIEADTRGDPEQPPFLPSARGRGPDPRCERGVWADGPSMRC